MSKAWGLAVAAVMPLLLAGVVISSRAVTPSLLVDLDDPLDDAVTVTSPASSNADDDDGAVDLYGNPVSAAVAKYQLDKTGSLYESHSPQTELPRLAPPKT